MISGQSALDDALDVLSNTFRRRLLIAMLERDPRVPVTPESFAIETKPPGRWNTYATHVHLPKLEDVGFIEWDRESGDVRRGPAFEEIEPLLELLDDNEAELAFQWP